MVVGGLACALILLGQLGLRGQDAGEGEEAGAGGDGGEAGLLAEAERERGHRQRQPLQLRELVSLELLLQNRHIQCCYLHHLLVHITSGYTSF